MKLIADKEITGYDFAFKCPGCGFQHGFDVTGNITWKFNGDLNKPTVSPSILITMPYYGDEKNIRCHSFIKDGFIQYLSDCSHKLAGQTIELAEIV
jgi:hypothetical protein